MQVENLSREERLKTELLRIRDETHVTQGRLATLSGVSLSTIKAIERGDPRPKAETLRLIADGAATYAPGRRDPELAADYHQRLMRAAGYIEDRPTEPERRRPVEDLTDEEVREALTRLMQDPKVSAQFLSVAEDWVDLAPSAQRFILNSFELARQMDEEVKAARSRDDSRSRRPRS